MAKINNVHVLGGGILAGVIINVSGGVAWTAGLGKEYLSQLGGSLPSRAVPLAIWWGLVMGIAAVWLYVSLRAQYKAGFRTAALAGVTTWILGYALPSYAIWSLGLLSGPLFVHSSAAALPQIMLATLAGAALYNRAGDSVTA